MPESSQAPLANPSAVAAVVLAAGKSTRMKSRLPKPLHQVCGRAVTRHVIEACRAAGVDRIVVVIGHEADAVRAGLGDDVEYALQAAPLGSADAAMASAAALADHVGPVLVLAGDVPLLRPETLKALVAAQAANAGAATLLTGVLDDAGHYGRIVRGPDGGVRRIVEYKDATADERTIREWNTSIYCFDGPALFRALPLVKPSAASGELYLTDTVEILAADGARIEGIQVEDVAEVLGVNTRAELAEVGAALRERVLGRLMASGVTVTDPSSTYVDVDVEVGPDTVLEPNTYLRGATRIGADCVIGPQAMLTNVTVGSGVRIVASHIIDSELGDGVTVGPFANIRPGCRVAAMAKIGDFVELKNSALGERVSVGHLSYIGDADVGAGTNVGAGTITCNFDGWKKHRTKIGESAFIGSHTTLVAPIEIGAGAITAAGSPLTQDVPADALAVARDRQVVRPDWARRWREIHAKREHHNG